MTKLGTAFWLGLVLASGFTTFKVKYSVQDIDDQLGRVRKQDIAEQQEIRVLNAEWTYLNQPERLAELNRKFLQLVPVAAKQMQQKIEDIALRPPPPPEPDVVVAAAPAVPLPAAPIPAVTPAVLAQAPVQSVPPVRVATAEAAALPASLDALFAQIAERR